MPDLGFPLLTPFLAARDLGKKNPDLKGNEKAQEQPKYGDPEDLYEDKRKGKS